ncbi:MAG: hypothetical protein ACYDBJ_20720 [Aggregatilineales bacterium]
MADKRRENTQAEEADRLEPKWYVAGCTGSEIPARRPSTTGGQASPNSFTGQ